MDEEINFQYLMSKWDIEIRYKIRDSSLTREQCIKIWNNFISDFTPYTINNKEHALLCSSLQINLRLTLNKAENNYKFLKRKNPLLKIPTLHFHLHPK